MNRSSSPKILIGRDFILLAILCLARAGFCLLLLKRGFVAVTGDEFLRGLISHYWVESPFFSLQNAGPAAAMWMPMHFWIVGSVLAFTGQIWATSIAVSLVFSIAELIALYSLGKILAGGTVGALTCALVVFMPWEIWLSIAALPSTIYHTVLLSGVFALVAWEKKRRQPTWLLAAASLCFLLSTMLRPEGWLFSVVFSIYLGILSLRSFRERKSLVLLAVLPWLFPLYWLWCNTTIHGHPFWFILESQRAYQMEAADVDSALVRLGQTPFSLFILSPVVVLLGVAAVVTRLGQFWREIPWRAYLLLGTGGFAMLVLGAAGGLGSNTAPQRFVVLFVLFAAIPAAVLLRDWWGRGGAPRLCAVSFFVLVMAVDLPRAWQINTRFTGDLRMGELLQKMMKDGRLDAGQVVCTEHELLLKQRIYPQNQAEKVDRFCADWAIRIGSNQPHRFASNLEDQFRRDSELWSAKISQAFDQGRVGLILVASKIGRENLPPGFYFVGGLGRWNFYGRAPHGTVALNTADSSYRWRHYVNLMMAEGIALADFGLEKNAFPRTIALRWKITGPGVRDYQVTVDYVPAGGTESVLSQKIAPFFGDYPTSAWPVGASVIQYIEMPPEGALPPAQYRIRISLVFGERLESAQFNSDLVWVVSSKRSAMKSILRAENRELGLVWRVLANL